jgi:hypothetical protein
MRQLALRDPKRPSTPDLVDRRFARTEPAERSTFLGGPPAETVPGQPDLAWHRPTWLGIGKCLMLVLL